MNKKVLSVLVLSLLLCAGCQGRSDDVSNESSSSVSQLGGKVTFYLNYDENDDEVYLTKTLSATDTLKTPVRPIRKDYVFAGWSTARSGTVLYDGFDSTISGDLSLYAIWTDYASMDDLTKVTRFLEKIKSLEGTVSETFQSESGTLMYYMPLQYGGQYRDEMEYHRYDDIMVQNYFYYNQDVRQQYGERQFFVQDNKAYDLYKDLENSADNKASYQNLSQNFSLDNWLDIGFSSIHLYYLYALQKQLVQQTYDQINYELNFNYDEVDEYSNSYSFSYSYYTLSNSSGIISEEEHIYTITIAFLNRKIVRSVAEGYSWTAIGGDLATEDEFIWDCKYTQADSIGEFEGERFNPSDFNFSSL